MASFRTKNWVEIPESTPGPQMEPGAYVCRVTGVNDVPSKEYMWIVFDVAEGAEAGKYAGMPPADDWKHRFTRSYKDSADGMFKAWLVRLEESNRGRFTVEGWQRAGCDERAFIGLEVGLIFQKERYTNDKGEDKERVVVAEIIAAQDVRSGDYKMPAPKDRRKKAEARHEASNDAAASSYYDEDVPF